MNDGSGGSPPPSVGQPPRNPWALAFTYLFLVWCAVMCVSLILWSFGETTGRSLLLVLLFGLATLVLTLTCGMVWARRNLRLPPVQWVKLSSGKVMCGEQDCPWQAESWFHEELVKKFTAHVIICHARRRPEMPESAEGAGNGWSYS